MQGLLSAEEVESFFVKLTEARERFGHMLPTLSPGIAVAEQLVVFLDTTQASIVTTNFVLAQLLSERQKAMLYSDDPLALINEVLT